MTMKFANALAPGLAAAGDFGTADPGLLLGTIRAFGTETAARLACKRDGVVHADRHEGFAHNLSLAKRGKTAAGPCCWQNATGGNDRDADLRSRTLGHPGRSFSSMPVLVGS